MDSWTPRHLLSIGRRARFVRVLAVNLGASFAALEAVDLLSEKIALPGWYLQIDPISESLRYHPRFQRLVWQED